MQRRLRGLILAGGRSTRMGRDKPSLLHADGRSLARRCYDLLAGVGCEMVTLSLRTGQELPAGFEDMAELEVIRDPEGGSQGPMAGMMAGMLTDPAADWLVVACDLPRLDHETLAALVHGRREGERFLAYRNEEDGMPEPLCTWYASEALPILMAAHHANIQSPRRILMDHQCRMLEPVSLRALENANTPDEWAMAMDTEIIPEWQAELQHIFISPGNDFKGRHGLGRLNHGIQELSEVECVAGKGLVGDRYYNFKPDFKGQVTFFDAAVVREGKEKFNLPDLSASLFRRNLIVSGVDLKEWQGKRFRFQGVEFKASEECKPCYWMDEAITPGMNDFLTGDFRGGLRARILSNGILRRNR